MKYNDREYYEKRISETPLFSMVKGTGEYVKARYVLIENLYLYLQSLNSQKYKDLNVEITAVAQRCIDAFNPENGEFLHYFNEAIATEYHTTIAMRKIDESRGGIHVSGTDSKKISKILKLLKSRGISADELTDDQAEIIATACGVSVEELWNLLETNYNVSLTFSELVGEDGELTSVFDTIPDSDEADSRILNSDAVRERLEEVDSAYLECQERTRMIISTWITARLCENWEDIDSAELEGYSFVDWDVIQAYCDGKKLPSQKDIAERYGKKEASISRTAKEFLLKLKEKIKK